MVPNLVKSVEDDQHKGRHAFEIDTSKIRVKAESAEQQPADVIDTRAFMVSRV